jgi:hypothetical protein
MAQQTINLGASANDGTGDPVRTAFSKVNTNTTELYALIAAGGGGGGGGSPIRTQRLVTASPIVVSATDQILNCNIPVNATCQLPPSGGRLGLALTFKDLGQASAHPIVITMSGAETADGHPSITINNNRQAVTFVPFNDGVNSGWALE